jgi:hypothetical protein
MTIENILHKRRFEVRRAFFHCFSVTCDEVGLAVVVAEPGPQEALGEGDEGHNGPVVGQGHQAQ